MSDESKYVLAMGDENNGTWYREDDVRYSKYTHSGGLYVGYYKGTKDYHNMSGPARIWKKGHPRHPDGHQEWYIDGERIPVNSQEEFERYVKMKAFW